MGHLAYKAPAPEKTGKSLLSGKLLAKNTLLNLLGNLLPIAISIVAVRLLVDGLGTERFGLLNLAWIIIGYFSLFDLGLGRALTKLVAERLESARRDEIPDIFRTTIVLMLIASSIGGGIAAALTPWFVRSVLHLQGELRHEGIQSFLILAAAIPWVVVTAGLRGYLEAFQRFDLVTAVRVPMSVFSYVGPLLVLPFYQSLTPVVVVLMAGRVIGTIVHFGLCLKLSPELLQTWKISFANIGELFRFGGWLTVSAIVGPFMIYMDRFLIGAYLSVTAVAYYATPYELVSRFALLSGALAGVMFPAFATSYIQDIHQAQRLYLRSVKYLALALFPVALGCIVFAYDGLLVWLGVEFALNSALVLKILSIGMWMNNLALMPFSLIQAAGKPDLSAKIHIVELPFYLILLIWLTNSFGIIGVAIAWTLRSFIDTLLMFAVGHRILELSAQSYLQIMYLGFSGVVIFGLAALPLPLYVRVIGYPIALAATFLAVWGCLFEVDERAWVIRMIHQWKI